MHKDQRRVIIQIILFIITFVTTTLSGSWWVSQRSVFSPDYNWVDFLQGMQFSIPFLLILTVHEFGHYFTARYYGVKATLPFYIPTPPLPFMIGTLGALIRLLSRVPSKKQNFDIGIAGPLAGFVMALVVLFYGFTHLPPPEYIFQIHPEYKQYGLEYAQHVYEQKENIIDISIGKNLLFVFFEKFVADPLRMPNPHEIMHYPFLFAGYLSLIFTFMNLLPVGQLDGGHVLYGLVGFKIHRVVASIFFVGFMFYAGLGNSFINPSVHSGNELILWTLAYIFGLYVAFTGLRLPLKDTLMYTIMVFAIQYFMMHLAPNIQGYEGWLIFGLVIGRFVGVQHPPCDIEEPLNNSRIILGWLAIVIFVICFSPAPIVASMIGE